MKHPNELDQQVSNLRTLQQSYDQIAGAAEAYNTGKVQLAENITSKGVEASATETLPELAGKVAQIAQTETILDGGEVMAAQQFGDDALWNLYQVLADMKTRFMGTGDYAALIVCEYYKGYDSLMLQGADGYFTCDGDYYDYASPTHVWHDDDNGKMNRWVAFLYRQDGARLDITNTAISPRSMYIGGHIGTIEYFVNGRLTELVCGVEETDVVDNFVNTNNYTQAWNTNNFVLRNVKNISNETGGKSDIDTSAIGLVYVNPVATGQAGNKSGQIIRALSAHDVYMSGIANITLYGHGYLVRVGSNINSVTIRQMSNVNRSSSGGGGQSLIATDVVNSPIQKIDIADTTGLPNSLFILLHSDSGEGIDPCPDLKDIIVGAFTTNLICNFWNPTNVLADATKKTQLIENIKNHILARVSDATGGTQLVFTVSLNMYNAIASETIEWQGETMSLADAFLTKNWLLAGV